MKKIIVYFALICGLLFAFPGFAANDAALIMRVEGDVQVLPASKTDWIKAGITMVLRSGDKVKTAKGSVCDISFSQDDKNMVGVMENSEVIILLDGNKKLQVVDATIFAKLKAIPRGSAFEIKTPVGICGARGTGLGVSGNDKGIKSECYENQIYTSNEKGEEKPVNEGYYRETDAQGNISDEKNIDDEKMRDYGSWEKEGMRDVENEGKAKEDKETGLTEAVEHMVEKTTDVSEKNDERKSDIKEEQQPEIKYEYEPPQQEEY